MRWDVPNKHWADGYHWDQTSSISLEDIHMSISMWFKLLLNFIYWGEARFSVKAEQIITAMTTAPMLTLVPDPLPATVAPRADAVQALADYKTAAKAAADGSKAAIKDRDAKRAILVAILTAWAAALELAAKKAGDLTILTMSGYDLRKPSIPGSGANGAPPAPVIVVKRAAVSGSVLVRVKPKLKGVDTYEGQYAVGDPTVEANFKGNLIPKTGTRILFTDLELAKLHQFRVRGYGKGGPGDWSDPVGMIVT